MSVEARTVYVDAREGPTPVTLPGDVIFAVENAAVDEDEAEPALTLAALVLVRLGAEAGGTLLRHWIEHDPRVLLGADPLLGETLAHEPELLTGPLIGAPSP